MNDALLRHAHAARAALLAGNLRGAALLERLLAVPPADRDAWTDELLGLGEPPLDTPLPRGAVPYLPAGVNEILQLVREAPLHRTDTLVDLGAGLGRVVILAHLLSGARALGIEIQAPLVERARACCAELALSDVAFLHANAAEAELEGSIFFLYAPFTGELLQRTLRRLQALARRHPIVLCTVDLELANEPWLRLREAASLSLRLYDSQSAN